MTAFAAQISRSLGVRDGEGRRALLMWTYVFLLISSLLVVKPVASSLFLSHFTAARLPVAFMMVALCAAVLSSLYARLLRTLPLDLLIRRGLILNAALLSLFWLLLRQDVLAGAALYALYVWVAVWGVASASLFWILANVLFNVREAKRLFPLIGTGAIAGAIAGGYLATLLANGLGSGNLLLVSVLLHGGCVGLVGPISKLLDADLPATVRPQLKAAEVAPDEGFAIIRGSRHLRLTAALVGLGVVVGRLVEFQYSAVASTLITNDDDLTAFFGFWSSTANIASFAVQLAVTGPLMRTIGVRAALFILPIGLLGAASALLVFPGLAAAIALRFTDNCFKQSINKAGLELLILPIPAAIKNRAKAVIDVFVDSAATGVGGLLLLALTFAFASPTVPAGLVTIVLTGVWLHLVVKVRREYLDSFRERIGIVGEPGPPPASIFESLVSGLQSDRPDLTEHLRMLEDIRDPRLAEPLQKLLGHSLPQVRAEALKNLYFYRGVDVSARATELLDDPDTEVRVEAMRYAFSRPGGGGVALIEGYLAGDDLDLRWSALVCASLETRTSPELRKMLRVPERIEEALRGIPTLEPQQRRAAKIACIEAIGGTRLSSLYGYLQIFLNEPAPEIVRVAIRAAARTQATEFLPVLIRHLSREDLEEEVREALADYGAVAVPPLRALLENSLGDSATRCRAARALGAIPGRGSVATLVASLTTPDPSVRFESVRALNRIRRRFPAIPVDSTAIDARVRAESREYLDTLSLLHAQRAGATTSDGTRAGIDPDLDRALHELIAALELKLDRYLERIFRLLGLKYPPEDIHTAYLGVVGDGAADMRANALEFLDNLLDPGLKRIIIPLVETTMSEALIEDILERFDVVAPDRRECLGRLLRDNDLGLKTATLDVIGLSREESLVPDLGDLINHPDVGVRDAAARALRRIGVLSGPE